MANQEDSSDSTLRAMPELPMPQMAYDSDRSNWSRNHGPVLIATAVFVLIVGSGVIFFNTAKVVDNSRPLVPDDFVPDDSTEIELPAESTTSQNNEAEESANTDANAQSDSEKQN